MLVLMHDLHYFTTKRFKKGLKLSNNDIHDVFDFTTKRFKKGLKPRARKG